MKILILVGLVLGIMSWIWSEEPAAKQISQQEIETIAPNLLKLMAYADTENVDELMLRAETLSAEQQRKLAVATDQAILILSEAERRYLPGHAVKKELQSLLRGAFKLRKVFAILEFSETFTIQVHGVTVTFASRPNKTFKH